MTCRGFWWFVGQILNFKIGRNGSHIKDLEVAATSDRRACEPGACASFVWAPVHVHALVTNTYTHTHLSTYTSVFDTNLHICKHTLRRACTCARVCAVCSLVLGAKAVEVQLVYASTNCRRYFLTWGKIKGLSVFCLFLDGGGFGFGFGLLCRHTANNLFTVGTHTNGALSFLVCYAATQLALQLQQERLQVVRSKKVIRRIPTESNGTPAMDIGHINVVLKWSLCIMLV